MKYLFINSVYGFGSTGRIIADKCEQLKNEGHECAAAYGRTCAANGAAQLIRIGTKPDYLFHAGITRLFDQNGYGSRAATQRLLSQIEHFQPDVIRSAPKERPRASAAVAAAFGGNTVLRLRKCYSVVKDQ